MPIENPPIENPPRRTFFAEIETVLHALNIYGAAGIAAFGWAMGCFLGVDGAPWLPLWFCAALLIYNCDRLRCDPADQLNIPRRAAACARWRPAIRGAVIGSALVLIGLPVWRRDWVTLYLVIAGSIVSLGYTIPVLGWRWKDVPLVKTLFAPTVVTAAVFGLMLDTDTYALSGWAWCYLFFNMLLCDLRDRTGDALCGVRSIAVVFGEKGSRRLLWALACAGQVLLVALIRLDPAIANGLALLAPLAGFYQAWLIYATRHPRSERFYEWAVEGLLYLPALAWVLAR